MSTAQVPIENTGVITTKIKCPNCRKNINLDEAIAGPMLALARADLEKEYRQRALEWADEKSNKSIKQAIADAETARKATQAAQEETKALDAKLKIAQDEQAKAIARGRQLEERERELDLEVQRKVNAERGEIRTAASNQVRSEYDLKLAERDQQLESMRTQITDLKQRAEQGSQQLQGEAQELILEQALQSMWPSDTIAPVLKGAFGGDVLQSVLGTSGAAGMILWESKRTKNWSDGWLVKLREDQRNARADVAVLVTQAMPQSLVDAGHGCGLVDGIWVIKWDLAIPVASVIRRGLIGIAEARHQSQGMSTKAEVLYQYLTSSQFQQRVSGVIEYVTTMSDDLDRERKFVQAGWAKREKQMQMVVAGMAGLYGDVAGIAGKAVGEIEGLTVKRLGAAE